MNKKKIIIIACALLVLIAGLIILFSIKSNKSKSQKEDENNYTIKFDYYTDKNLQQRVTFIYKDKELSDITITVYFESKAVANAVYKEYKSNKEFKDYKTEKNRVILYYKDADVKPYKSYTKEQIVEEFTSMGYIEKK